MGWYRSPDVAEAEAQAGRGAPLPGYVDDIALARWLGIAPWELMDAPRGWYNAAMIVMNAEAVIQREKQGKGGT